MAELTKNQIIKRAVETARKIGAVSVMSCSPRNTHRTSPKGHCKDSHFFQTRKHPLHRIPPKAAGLVPYKQQNACPSPPCRFSRLRRECGSLPNAPLPTAPDGAGKRSQAHAQAPQGCRKKCDVVLVYMITQQESQD